MSRRSAGDNELEFGGTPRVHLLPPEVGVQKKDRAFRRRLLSLLVLAALIVAAGMGFTSYLLSVSLTKQSEAQAEGLSLVQQAKKYSSVTGVQTQVNNITAAQPNAVKGEILWQPFIASIEASLPKDVVMTDLTAKLSGTGDEGELDPLSRDHVATVEVAAVGKKESLTRWLTNVLTVPGVVRATPGEVAISPDPKLYVVNVDLLVDGSVVSTRFEKAK